MKNAVNKYRLLTDEQLAMAVRGACAILDHAQIVLAQRDYQVFQGDVLRKIGQKITIRKDI